MRGTDTFRTYLEQIGRYPLLRPEQEIELSRRIARLKELQALERPLTKAEQREERAGNLARDRMICCNLRLVVTVAKRYVRICDQLTIDDLIQEGSAGIIVAAERFDGTRGYKFSTFAYWWIRQGITRAIANQDLAIRLPIHAGNEIRKLKRLAAKHYQMNGRPPTAEWLAEQTGMDAEKVNELLSQAVSMCSLDVMVHEDGSPLVDLIPSPDSSFSSSPDDYGLVQRLMRRVRPEDQELVNRYYGLIDGQRWSMEAIGKLHGVSRSRVQQRIYRAVSRMRPEVELQPSTARKPRCKTGRPIDRRRTECAKLYREGMSRKAIAKQLGVARSTVARDLEYCLEI